MKLSRYLLTGLALASLSTAALGQVTVTPPNTVDAQGRSRATGTTFIVNADGSIATIGGTTGTATTPSDRVTTVQGTSPNGSPTTGQPVTVAGSDGTNTRTIRTGTLGQLIMGGQVSAGADGITQVTSVSEPGGGSRPLWTVGGVYNGTSYDRQYSANAASGTTGTGLLGVGNLGFDGTNWRGSRVDGNGYTQILGVGTGAAIRVEGVEASGVTIASRPLGVGGFASSTAPTAVTTGQRVNGWYGLNGQAIVQLGDAGGLNGFSPGNNDSEGSNPRLRVRAVLDVLNSGGSNDRIRDATAANATTGTGLLGAGILGQYTATLPTYTTGQFGTLSMNPRGLLQTVAVDGSGNPQFFTAAPASDGVSASAVGTVVSRSNNMQFNGSTWDRSRSITGADGTGLGVNSVAETPNSAAGAAIVPATALGATSLVGKASPGNLYGATVTAATTQTGAGYFIVANLAAAPASGTALTAAQVLYCVAVQPGATASMGGTGVPDRGTVGLTALYSTACNTFTPQATAPLHMRLRTQ